MPRWMLPPLLQRLAEVLPISRMVDATRAVIVYDQALSEALAEHTPPSVLAATAMLLAIGVLVYRRLLEKSIEHPRWAGMAERRKLLEMLKRIEEKLYAGWNLYSALAFLYWIPVLGTYAP